MEISSICICGGGSLGTVIAGVLSSKGIKVNLLTNHPASWSRRISVTDPCGKIYAGALGGVSAEASDLVPDADMVLLCLPGFLIKDELLRIKPFLKPGAFVGSVFSSTGFFFEALRIFGSDTPLWGFQRVPYIARVRDYGHSAALLGYKDSYNIAVENADAATAGQLRRFVEEYFERPTCLLGNYLEASITNSNPLLHTSRIYTIFKDWTPTATFPRCPYFYEEWTDEASDLLIRMDRELFDLIGVLPVNPGFIKPILEYYESSDACSLTSKIRSIESFKRILSPMTETDGGFTPDFTSRYFVEDFGYGLKYIYELAKKHSVVTSVIDTVYRWGRSVLESR